MNKQVEMHIDLASMNLSAYEHALLVGAKSISPVYIAVTLSKIWKHIALAFEAATEPHEYEHVSISMRSIEEQVKEIDSR